MGFSDLYRDTCLSALEYTGTVCSAQVAHLAPQKIVSNETLLHLTHLGILAQPAVACVDVQMFTQVVVQNGPSCFGIATSPVTLKWRTMAPCSDTSQPVKHRGHDEPREIDVSAVRMSDLFWSAEGVRSNTTANPYGRSHKGSPAKDRDTMSWASFRVIHCSLYHRSTRFKPILNRKICHGEFSHLSEGLR